MKKIKKLHLTEHQKQNLENSRPGHDYDVEDVQKLLDDPEHVDTQDDGRIVLHGWLDNVVVRAVLSCTPFRTGTAGIVTTHKSRMPKDTERE